MPGMTGIFANARPLDGRHGFVGATQIERKTEPYGVVFLTSLLLPKSVGYIRVNSADPLVYPIIEPNYCEDPVRADARAAALGMVQPKRTDGPIP